MPRAGLYLRPRYSPGYGDLALGEQAVFFRLLELPKRLGLSLSEAYIMSPEQIRDRRDRPVARAQKKLSQVPAVRKD